MARKESKGDGFSLRTKDAVEGGGGTEGALATITEIDFVDEFTYGGRFREDPQAALRVVFDIDGQKKPWEQHYSLGKSKNFEVVADGDGIRSTNKAAGLNKRTPAFIFFSALEAAAEAADLDLDELLPEIEDEEGVYSVRPLEGRCVRLTNTKYETVGGDTKEAIVIASFEEDEKPAKGKSASKSAGKSATHKSDAIEQKTEEAVKALLEDESSIKKANLSNEVYDANRKDPDAKAMMQLCLKDTWVFSEDRPWDSDKKKGVIRAREE